MKKIFKIDKEQFNEIIERLNPEIEDDGEEIEDDSILF